MAIINVPDTDTFDMWRQKMNLLAQLQGDLTLLATPLTTDLVSAINSTFLAIDGQSRRTLILSIAMS